MSVSEDHIANDLEREWKRQNFIDARKVVGEREALFFSSLKTTTTYGLLANAGALMSAFGFLGASSGKLTVIWPVILAMIPFGLGCIFAGCTIYSMTILFRDDLKTSTKSFIEAAVQDDLVLFTDTSENRDDQIKFILRFWWAAGVCFVIGCCALAFALGTAEWHQ